MTETTLLDPALVREFVIAGHGNLERVREMLAEEPALLNAVNEWRPGDTETALQGASHVGNRAIAEYLLAQGAPNAITTAAMLGDRTTVEAMLAADPDLIHARGAHDISLLAHVAWSGDMGLMAMLYQRGATAGESMALAHAVARGDVATVKWMLEFADPDLAWKNYQGQTVLDTALATGATDVADALRSYGAEEGA
jgi:ankyrin repeat protein